MLVKLIDSIPSPMIGHKICYCKKAVNIEERFLDKVREKVNQGIAFQIYDNGKWVDADIYFSEKGDIGSKPQGDVIKKGINFNYIFENGLHWKKQIQRVEEFEDVNQVKRILKYAQKNNISDGVIKNIKKYLNELR